MNLFQAKHELWLQLLFGSFSVSDDALKTRLYEFSEIAFRHLKWIATDYREHNIYYNYQRSDINIQFKDVFSLLSALKKRLEDIQAFYDERALCERMSQDETYLFSCIAMWQSDLTCNAPITAFDKQMRYEAKALSTAQRDALILFLFEESYKEYELIMVYFYMQTYTDDLQQYRVFGDLIDESHFHLKHFGTMLAKMGLLALPREVHEMSYKIDDFQEFLRNGIDEEHNAKEECRKLAQAVNDDELQRFFDFINSQESYHIELMKRLL